jgi:hypothetical protein
MAEVLGISQAAAKQRLARGRAMLSVRVERALGSALRHTTPGSTFTLTVMGALAASAPPASAAPATGVLLSKTALAGSAGNLAAPFLALTGVFAGLWSLARAQTAKAQLSEERQFTARMYLRLTVICSVFGMLLGLGIAIHPGSALWVGGLTPLIIAGAAWRVGLWMSRRRQSIRTCHGDQSDTPKGSSRSTLDKPESQKSILGIITAVGCFPLVYAGLLILPDPEVPRWITGTFMGTCAGLSILTAGIVSLRPGSFRGVTLGLFTSLTTSTALLAWLLTRVWHESGRSVAETPASGLLLHCLVTLGVITLAWALHSFRHAR